MKYAHCIPVLAAMAVALAGCQAAGPAQRAATEGNAENTVRQPGARQPRHRAEVFFRLAQAKEAKGLSELRLSGGSIWVLPQPVLSRADLSSVEPIQTQQGRAFVRFGFTQEGARKLQALSRRFPGKLLVLTIDNDLVAAPRIGKPLTQGEMVVGVASGKQAMAIARAIAEPRGEAR
ncbi:MAG TPA: preprotein translocase subunit SecD [Eoetvoesiella sp.]|uniref:SecDF P1 head subdomain-containing protein n=1 Tax=Eoetvoesiella sp. TaxID=1966355 RepID=UPI002C5D916C|nr:preprotein translocase subunit SecD [Eoetvoesiella sp.]HWK60588.1 preprotein translocase subunit SecD [Eoetvoesiella sp.]